MSEYEVTYSIYIEAEEHESAIEKARNILAGDSTQVFKSENIATKEVVVLDIDKDGLIIRHERDGVVNWIG